MERVKKIILISIISIAAISWIVSKDQPDMMTAMMNYKPVAISLFTISWTIGMAAMMFPAITPMVLLYNRLIKNNRGNPPGKGINQSQTSVFVERDNDDNNDKTAKIENRTTLSSLLSNLTNSANTTIFIGSYLLVWAITGIVLLLAWSIPVNYFIVNFQTSQLQVIYGIVLLVSGVYQFSFFKNKMSWIL